MSSVDKKELIQYQDNDSTVELTSQNTRKVETFRTSSAVTRRHSSTDYQLEPVTDDDDDDDDDLESDEMATESQFYDDDHEPGSRPEVTKRKRRITKDQRLAANKRERKRMLSLNTAFERLKKTVPVFPHERKLSRIQTLRLAMSYISFMTDLLWENPSSQGVVPGPQTAASSSVAAYHQPQSSQTLPPIHFGMAYSHHIPQNHHHHSPYSQSPQHHFHHQTAPHPMTSQLTASRRNHPDANMTYIGY